MTSLTFYKIFMVLFFLIYQFGPSFDNYFREAVYVVLTISLLVGLVMDAYGFWRSKQEKKQKIKELTTSD